MLVFMEAWFRGLEVWFCGFATCTALPFVARLPRVPFSVLCSPFSIFRSPGRRRRRRPCVLMDAGKGVGEAEWQSLGEYAKVTTYEKERHHEETVCLVARVVRGSPVRGTGMGE